ncbi:MAG: hypothetical protein QM820_31420 [Minicystis sp.]
MFTRRAATAVAPFSALPEIFFPPCPAKSRLFWLLSRVIPGPLSPSGSAPGKNWPFWTWNGS